MFTKIANSWNLVKMSAKVLQADKELLIFPIISTIGVTIVSATFLIPMFLADFFDSLISKDFGVLGLVVLFLFYFVQYLVIFFANTALVGAALVRIRGGDPTVKNGLDVALKNFWPILGYAAIAATVGMILKLLERRGGAIQKIVVSLVGMAWNLVTYLVVPILAAEGIGPIAAIKKSATLLKKTWGEQISGNLGLGAFFGLVYIILFEIFLPLIILTVTNEIWAGAIALGIIFILILIFTGLVNSALSGIYSAAVYEYATTGQTGAFFEANLVKEAFKVN